jgi:O-acetyl-ADP-ribose deacetylase (regulator of RNase III)
MMPVKISFTKGDITEMAVEALVNAANTELDMEAGVAAAIRRKGGPRIQDECERLGHLRLGAAAATTGGNLKANYVIHAATMQPRGKATAESIRLATHQSLLRAEEKTIKTLAFPALGTGVAGFPIQECAQVMLKVVLDHIKMRSTLERICFVLFDDAALKVFEETYQQLTARPLRGNKG